MRITAELSLYPIQNDHIPPIENFIHQLLDRNDLEIKVTQLSTQIRGELRTVMVALTEALEASFNAYGTQVLVAKILNADLPIADPVTLAG